MTASLPHLAFILLLLHSAETLDEHRPIRRRKKESGHDRALLGNVINNIFARARPEEVPVGEINAASDMKDQDGHTVSSDVQMEGNKAFDSFLARYGVPGFGETSAGAARAKMPSEESRSSGKGKGGSANLCDDSTDSSKVGSKRSTKKGKGKYRPSHAPSSCAPAPTRTPAPTLSTKSSKSKQSSTKSKATEAPVPKPSAAPTPLPPPTAAPTPAPPPTTAPTPVPQPTASPSEVEDLQPPTASPTIAPSIAITVPTVAPISRSPSTGQPVETEVCSVYESVNRDPSALHFSQGIALTCEHLEEVIKETLSLGAPAVISETVTCVPTSFSISPIPPVEVCYELVIIFDPDSTFTPTSDEIDELICLILEPPTVNDLLDNLQALASSNPFSDTTGLTCADTSVTTDPPTVAPSTETPTVAPTTDAPSIAPTTATTSPPVELRYDITQQLLMPAEEQAVFEASAAKWESIVVGDISDFPSSGLSVPPKEGCTYPEVIDDIFICGVVEPM